MDRPFLLLWLFLDDALPSWRRLAEFAWAVMLLYLLSHLAGPTEMSIPYRTDGYGPGFLTLHHSAAVPLLCLTCGIGYLLFSAKPRRTRIAAIALSGALAVWFAWFLDEPRRFRQILQNSQFYSISVPIYPGHTRLAFLPVGELTPIPDQSSLKTSPPVLSLPGWQWIGIPQRTLLGRRRTCGCMSLEYYPGNYRLQLYDKDKQLLGSFGVSGSQGAVLHWQPAPGWKASDRIATEPFRHALDQALLAALPTLPHEDRFDDRSAWISLHGWLTRRDRPDTATASLSRIAAEMPRLNPGERERVLYSVQWSLRPDLSAPLLLTLADDPSTTVRQNLYTTLDSPPFSSRPEVKDYLESHKDDDPFKDIMAAVPFLPLDFEAMTGGIPPP